MAVERLALRPTGLTPQQETTATLLPVLIYGTAWKKDRSADLVYKALRAGFRAVDTAAQPKHYREDLVGRGIRRAIDEGIASREDLYVSIDRATIAVSLMSSVPILRERRTGKRLYLIRAVSTDPNKIHLSCWTGSEESALRSQTIRCRPSACFDQVISA
jgi:hypothetical protein